MGGIYYQVYYFLPLLCFFVNIFLATLVLRSGWKNRLHQIFGSFLIFLGLWGLTIFGMRSSVGPNEAYLWERMVFTIIPFSAATLFHFVVDFTRSQSGRRLLPFLYAGVFAFGGFAFTGLTVTGMQMKTYGWAPVLGPLFPPYVILIYAPSLLSMLILIRANRTALPKERRQHAYIIAGALCSLFGGTTDYLPVLGVPIYPLGIVGNIFFGLFATIAVVWHRLLDPVMVMRKGFAYIALSTFIVMFYGIAFWGFNLLFSDQATEATALASIAAIVFASIILQPAVGRAQRWIDRFFQRERWDYLEALKRFAQETWDVRELARLSSSLVSIVTHAMQSERVFLMLPSPTGDRFVIVEDTAPDQGSSLSISENSPLVVWLTSNDQTFRPELLFLDPYLRILNPKDREAMSEAGIALLVPLKGKDELTGILALGPKLAGGEYTWEDTDLLKAVSRQAATSIENARLYAREMERLSQLEDLEKLKSSLLLTVSHELKTPMTAIRTAVDLLTDLEQSPPNSPRGRLLSSIRRGVDRLQRLVQESLDYARMQSSRLEMDLQPTDIRTIFDEVSDLMGSAVRAKGQRLELDVPDILPDIVIDSQSVERVLVNLLSNASKFTPEGGSIRIACQPNSGSLLISVTDTGPGIPMHEIPLLFEEYYRGTGPDTKGQEGSGLGLAIAKHLVEQHGGKIWVTSQEGQGSTFSFSLPTPSGPIAAAALVVQALTGERGLDPR
ncbi:MAG: ATP-binding protein [Dehalococcoidia bacterium]|nr:ATP-binding protein [Dehalococcoidia bacterium]